MQQPSDLGGDGFLKQLRHILPLPVPDQQTDSMYPHTGVDEKLLA